jgi:hypothetical protein
VPRQFLPIALAAVAAAGEGPAPGDALRAALEGRGDPASVPAPGFDPELAALSWGERPREEVIEALAARLVRGEARAWFEPAPDLPPLPDPPGSGAPAAEGPLPPVADRLASWVPADAAALFHGSLDEALTAGSGRAVLLRAAFGGGPRGDGPWYAGAVDDALGRLLLPAIWRSNPGVRTGTRQAAVVLGDPGLERGLDLALAVEVDDATLVLSHRRATFAWEDRSPRRLLVEGLDARTEDGAVRSFFALEGGVAVWSTTRALRDRILAAGAGRIPSLLRPDPREYAAARRAFPASEGGLLAILPEGFAARANARASRAARAAALRCEAALLWIEARAAAGRDPPAASCPAGGTLAPGRTASCSVHGTRAYPVPLGDLPAARPSRADGGIPEDALGRGELPRAARRREGRGPEFAGRGTAAGGAR